MILFVSDIIYKDTLAHDLNEHDLDNKDQVRDLTAEPAVCRVFCDFVYLVSLRVHSTSILKYLLPVIHSSSRDIVLLALRYFAWVRDKHLS